MLSDRLHQSVERSGRNLIYKAENTILSQKREEGNYHQSSISTANSGKNEIDLQKTFCDRPSPAKMSAFVASHHRKSIANDFKHILESFCRKTSLVDNTNLGVNLLQKFGARRSNVIEREEFGKSSCQLYQAANDSTRRNSRRKKNGVIYKDERELLQSQGKC